MHTHDIVVVGSGIFGITAALELHARGQRVAVIDPGPIPHPLAASTDISKAVRAEYGADKEYTIMMEEARPRWLAWNEEFGETLYYEWGVTMLTRSPMGPGGYEYESYQICKRRGHPIERLDSAEIARRFPAWNAEVYVDGYFSRHGGWAASGRVVEVLVEKARRVGIELFPGQTAEELLNQGDHVVGVRTAREGETFHAGTVVVAMGTWSWLLVPELKNVMKSVGMPVFHLKPADPQLFSPPLFSNWAADVSHTGWYGFPLHPQAGVVKVGFHGPGPELHPERDGRVVTEEDERRLRAFLAETFPALADAPVVYTRRCLYCDTFDEHFWIARHPQRSSLVVAAGGSGHAFKFGPILGDMIANAVEGKPDWRLQKFRWREPQASTQGQEASRFHE